MAKRPRKRHIYKKKESKEKSFFKSKWFIISIIAFVLIAGGILAAILIPKAEEEEAPVEIIPHTYEIKNVLPHDKLAFTQGLVYHDGYFYEGTGLFGQSQIRKVDPKTGEVLKSHSLPRNIFGEGVTIFDGKIYQLTWKAGIVYVYDLENFEPIDTFHIEGEGWGLTTDGDNLILSNGSEVLYYYDPNTFDRISETRVFDERGPVTNLNELEYIDGTIFANIWRSYKIVAIEPGTGKVKYWIDFSGIIDKNNYKNIDVMNGIAYDEATNRFFVTGKYWPFIYDVSILPPEEK